MPHRSRQIILLLPLLLATPIAARAESPAGRDVRRTDIRLSAQGYYDSDILRGQALGILRPDARQADYVGEPRLTADIVLPFGEGALFANGTLGYRVHARNSFLDREMIDTHAGLRLRPLSACTTSLAGAYARQQSDLANIFDAADPTNIETRVSGSADLSCETPGGLSTRLGYRHSRARNSAAQRRSSAYDGDSITGALGVARPRLGVVSLYGRYSTTRYPNRRLLGPDTPDGTEVYEAGLRYERQLGTRLTGEVSAGYTQVDPRLSGVRRFKGANWSADLTYDSHNRLRLTLDAERAVEQSNLIGDSYGITTRYQLSADYALSRRIVLTTGAAYIRRRFEQSPVLQLTKFNSHDRTSSVYARLTAGNVGPVAITFDAAHDHRTAAVPDFNYRSTRVGVTATYRFGR